jgi:hypothetical protein
MTNRITRTEGMARLGRRGFIAASSAPAAAPASELPHGLRDRRPTPGICTSRRTSCSARAEARTSRSTSYQPPTGVTPNRMAIIHLFGGGFFVGTRTRATSSTTPRRSGPGATRIFRPTYRCRRRAPGVRACLSRGSQTLISAAKTARRSPHSARRSAHGLSPRRKVLVTCHAPHGGMKACQVGAPEVLVDRQKCSSPVRRFISAPKKCSSIAIRRTVA